MPGWTARLSIARPRMRASGSAPSSWPPVRSATSPTLQSGRLGALAFCWSMGASGLKFSAGSARAPRSAADRSPGCGWVSVLQVRTDLAHGLDGDQDIGANVRGDRELVPAVGTLDEAP